MDLRKSEVEQFLVVLVPKAGQAPLQFLVGVTLVSGQLLLTNKRMLYRYHL